jgi:hypothetical protein
MAAPSAYRQGTAQSILKLPRGSCLVGCRWPSHDEALCALSASRIAFSTAGSPARMTVLFVKSKITERCTQSMG